MRAAIVPLLFLIACNRSGAENAPPAPAPTPAPRASLPSAPPSAPGSGGPQITREPSAPLAQAAAPWVTLSLGPAIDGFRLPLSATHAGDGSGRLFVVEQGGLVQVVKDGRREPHPFLDVRGLLGAVGGEQGLLGLAFHPRFAENGRLFFSYTDKDRDNAYAEVRANPARTRADMSTLRVLFAVPDFASNHNGGHLAFGKDGLLYLGTGDGGGGGDPRRTSQDDQNLLGKLLVLDVDKLPATGRVTPGIVAKGLRNPWRYSFDRHTGDLWLADVGQNQYEFVFLVDHARLKPKAPVLNFGWSVVEGAHCFRPERGCDARGFERVVFEYPHGEAGCSITGGYVYRGQANPAWVGSYVVGDYCSGRVWTVKREGARFVWARALDTKKQISSFGEDEAGELWLVDHGGAVYPLRATPSAAPR